MQPTGRVVRLKMHVWKGDLMMIRLIHTYSVDTNKTLLRTLHFLLAVVAQSLEMGDLITHSTHTTRTMKSVFASIWECIAIDLKGV